MISIGGARERQQSAGQHSPSGKTSAEAVARLQNVRVGHCGGGVLRTVGVAGDLDTTAPVFLAVVGLFVGGSGSVRPLQRLAERNCKPFGSLLLTTARQDLPL
jgi:hypothetical protein